MRMLTIAIAIAVALVVQVVSSVEAAEKSKPFIGRDDGRVQQNTGSSKNLKAKGKAATSDGKYINSKIIGRTK